MDIVVKIQKVHANVILGLLASIVVNMFVPVTMHGWIFPVAIIQLMPHLQNARIWFVITPGNLM